MQDRTDPDALLTPSEVAEMFRVNPKTVTRWARAGKISAIRTLGGHRRFRAIEIMRYLEQVESEHGSVVSIACRMKDRPSRRSPSITGTPSVVSHRAGTCGAVVWRP